MAASAEQTIPLPSSLALAEKWANEAGKKTKRVMSNPLPDGTKLPLVLVTHGAFVAVVREQGSCLVVSVSTKIPDQVRKKLAELDAEAKLKLFIVLRGELSSNGRAPYALYPPKLDSVDQLEGFSVEQLLKISEDNVCSFNRFCDAIQEVVTIIFRAISIFGLFGQAQSPSTTSTKSAPASLYG